VKTAATPVRIVSFMINSFADLPAKEWLRARYGSPKRAVRALEASKRVSLRPIP